MWGLRIDTESEKTCNVILPMTIQCYPIDVPSGIETSVAKIVGSGKFTLPDLPMFVFLDEIPFDPDENNFEKTLIFARPYAERIVQKLSKLSKENGDRLQRIRIELRWFPPESIAKFMTNYRKGKVSN